MPDCPADWQPTPDAVAEVQRDDVARAVAELGAGATVLLVSERTGLHPFVVVRRVRELGSGVAEKVAGMDWRPVKVERTADQRAASKRFFS